MVTVGMPRGKTHRQKPPVESDGKLTNELVTRIARCALPAFGLGLLIVVVLVLKQ